MFLFRGLLQTVRGKLLLITLASTAASILTFGVLVLAFDLYGYHWFLNKEMLGLADVMGQNCQTPLLFKDPHTAESVLQTLGQEKRIKAAYLFQKDGNIFASFPKNENREDGWAGSLNGGNQPTARVQKGYLVVTSPIKVEGDFIGWVALCVSLDSYEKKVIQYFVVFALVGLLACFTGWVIARSMQHIIADPINELLVASRLISQEKNYQFRVAKHTDDEIGALIDSFNEMLVQINTRDKDLVHSKDKMEQRVMERTRELQSEVEERKRAQQVVNNLLMKISQDNEMLMHLDQMKTDFLSIVSHELRTPLTAIMGYLKLLMGGAAGPVNDAQKEFLMTVTRNSERLYQLVNDLLDLSRLEAGKIQLMPTKVDVTRLLESSITNLHSLANPKKIVLAVVKPEESIFVEADAGRLEQVVVNLVGNAVKFTPANGRVEVGVRVADKEGSPGIELWVKDNGIGMSTESLTHIFDKFYQVENSSTRTAGGTGLGLSITQKLVEAHGGTITVESEEGKGSLFTIFLPKTFKGKVG
jgi:signal transduction histidine kinase